MAKKEEDLRAYKLDKDVHQVLHNIVSDIMHDKSLKNKWNLPFKDGYWCNIKIHGDQMELRTECLKGGFRTNKADILELQKFARETKKDLGKFERAVRSEFKKRTGKALKWGKGKEFCNYEMIAMNGMYKFYCYKSGPIKVDLGGQEFSEGGPDPIASKNESDDDYQIVDVAKLGHWG